MGPLTLIASGLPVTRQETPLCGSKGVWSAFQKLCLLCEVVVVLAFIKLCANKRHAFGF
jgi:hypothetical protein